MPFPNSSSLLRTRTPARSFSTAPIRRLPYLSALDGLRAIAVVAVMVYHADAGWLPGGYLGVEVFFTISGYLITALLITEFERTGGVDLIDFWKRRAKRLLPALGVLLIGVAILSLFTARDALGNLTGQAAAALTYVTNWSLILTEQSYFESFGRPPLLQHLWSLAIEEQFYLAFPPLFILGRRLLGKRVSLAVIVVGVIASAALMWNLFEPNSDPSRLYYGTDTRAAGILVGVALAMIWRPWASMGVGSVRTAAIPDVVGLGGFVLLISQFVLLGAYDERLYRGGFLLVSLATAGVIAAIVTPGSFLSVPLSWSVLRWIGARSYGLYLWHWPLFMVLRPGVDTVVGDPWLTVVRLGATVAIAELSYAYVEQPIREGRFVQQFREFKRAAPEKRALRRGSGIVVASVIAMAAVGNVQLPVDAAIAATQSPMVQDQSADAAGRGGPVALIPTPSVSLVPDAVGSGSPATGQMSLEDRYARIYVYGDSVLVGASEAFEGLADNVVLDARIGRQWHELVTDERQPGPDDAVVIHLGSNGATNTATIDQVLSHFEDAGRVVLVNVRVPRPWESAVNRSLSGATGRWPNTRLADWNGASDGTPAYFDGDGVHVSDSGAAALASVVTFGLQAD